MKLAIIAAVVLLAACGAVAAEINHKLAIIKTIGSMRQPFTCEVLTWDNVWHDCRDLPLERRAP